MNRTDKRTNTLAAVLEDAIKRIDAVMEEQNLDYLFDREQTRIENARNNLETIKDRLEETVSVSRDLRLRRTDVEENTYILDNEDGQKQTYISHDLIDIDPYKCED